MKRTTLLRVALMRLGRPGQAFGARSKNRPGGRSSRLGRGAVL